MATKTTCDICGKELFVRYEGKGSLIEYEVIPCSKIDYVYTNCLLSKDYCADCTEKILRLVHELEYKYKR